MFFFRFCDSQSLIRDKINGCDISYFQVFNPFRPSGLFYLNSQNRFISCIKGLPDYRLLLPCFVEISELHANSVDPDLTPRSGSTTVCQCFMGRLALMGQVDVLCAVSFNNT